MQQLFKTLSGRIRGLALIAASVFAIATTAVVNTAPIAAPVAIGAGLLATATPSEAALSFVTSLRQSRCQAIVTAAGANAVVRLYSGTKPTTTAGAGTLPAATGTLLATLTAGTTVGTCTAGVLDFDEASFTQTSSGHVAGTPGYIRVLTSGSVAIADIDVCGSAPCLTFTGTVATGQNVTLTSITFTEGNV